VLSDYHLPHITASAGLALLRESGRDASFVVVSSESIGEEAGVAILREGAQDYVSKDNLMRLGAAVGRELKDAEARRARDRAELEER
jgi:CheY-like chemotaxis protein